MTRPSPRKCLDKIAEFHRRGRTIVFVTHALGLVEKMCDQALWLRHGRMADHGDPKRVIDAYLSYVAGGEEKSLTADGERAFAEAAGDPAAAGVRRPLPERARPAGAIARSRSARCDSSTCGGGSGTCSYPVKA